MKRVLLLAVALAVAAAPAFAQGKKKGEGKAAAMKTMNAMGSVSAVSATSLTVKTKTGDMTFDVDAKTNVQAPGASHKSAAAKAEAKATPITDFVKVGDDVSVRYHDMGTSKHAANVMVKAAKPAGKKK